jgi:hypothetical protein
MVILRVFSFSRDWDRGQSAQDPSFVGFQTAPNAMGHARIWPVVESPLWGSKPTDLVRVALETGAFRRLRQWLDYRNGRNGAWAVT